MKKDLSEDWKIYKEKGEEIEKLLDESRKLRENRQKNRKNRFRTILPI